MELPWRLSGKKLACNAGGAGDVSLILGSGRSPGGSHGNPLQYFCLESPMDSLEGYTPWGYKELDRTKVTFHAHTCMTMVHIGMKASRIPNPAPKNSDSSMFCASCRKAEVSQASLRSGRRLIRLKQLVIRRIESQNLSVSDTHS